MDAKFIKTIVCLIFLFILALFQYESGGLAAFSQHIFKSLALGHCVVDRSFESKNLFSIFDVVDGDTVDILKNCKTIRLRLLGMNTPETVDPRKSVQCYGPEASAEAKKILTGKTIRLESDSSVGEFDKYGRTLAYIYLPSATTSYNEFMIQQGFAYEYTYDKPYKYQKEFKEVQAEAKENQSGLWSSSTCKGKL